MPQQIARPSLTPRHDIHWRNGVFTVFGMCGIGLASWMARTPAVKQALGISTAEMGLLILGMAIGSIFGLLVSRRLVERFDARRVMASCMVVMPIGLCIAGVAVTFGSLFWLVFVGLGVLGFGMGTCDVAMNLSGAANERVLGRTLMPVFHAFFSFGTMIGAGLGALAEVIHLSLAAHFAIIATVMLIGGIVGALATRAGHGHLTAANSHSTDQPSPRRFVAWRDPQTLLIGVIVLGMAFAEGSADDWLSLASVEGHGVDKPTGAVIFGVFVAAMTVGRLAGPRFLDRYGRVPVLRASAGLAALGLLDFIFVPVLWLAIAGVVLWGLGSALGFPMGMSAAADDPRTAAARVSVVAMIGYFAFLVGPPAIGFLGEHFGLLRALLLVFVLIAIAGVASNSARERTVS